MHFALPDVDALAHSMRRFVDAQRERSGASANT